MNPWESFVRWRRMRFTDCNGRAARSYIPGADVNRPTHRTLSVSSRPEHRCGEAEISLLRLRAEGRRMNQSDTKPRLAPSVYVADGAIVRGDVTLGERASIWFNAVVRGDEGPLLPQNNFANAETAAIPASIRTVTRRSRSASLPSRTAVCSLKRISMRRSNSIKRVST